MDSKTNAWRTSLAKGSLLCRKNGHQGDAQTIDEVADFLLKPQPIGTKISKDQKAKLCELIGKYAEAKLKIGLSSVDELPACHEFHVAADNLRMFIESIAEAT